MSLNVGDDDHLVSEVHDCESLKVGDADHLVCNEHQTLTS